MLNEGRKNDVYDKVRGRKYVREIERVQVTVRDVDRERKGGIEFNTVRETERQIERDIEYGKAREG